MKKLLLLSFTLFLSCLGVEEENLLVKVSTEIELLPLYLSPIDKSESSFPPQYVSQLEEVLAFDFNHNGMTSVVKSNHSPSNFTLKAAVKGAEFSAYLLSVSSGQTKSITGITLSGNLAEDRKKLHSVADNFFKALFDREGIATTKILYTLKYQDPSKKWVSDLYEADYDGGNARKIVSDGGYIVTPAYIAPKPGMKSGSCVFVSYKTGQPKIYLAHLKEGTLQRFSLLKGNQLMPTISKQKDQIAFISDVTGNPDLFLQQFDPEKGAIGKPRQIYSTHKATQASPTFSPDGKKIAFVSNKDGSPKIYVIDIPPPNTPLKEIKASLISKTNRENTAPVWSPDGKKIAYCSMSKGVRQIWLYDFDTRREIPLTTTSGNKENPSFAPNSEHIVFNTTGTSGSELYLVNLNDREPVKISKGSGEKHFPSWEPRG